MKTVGLRSLYDVAPFLTEDVLIVRDRQIIGTYHPIEGPGELSGMLTLTGETTEATVDNIKKAIETDQVKRQPRGRLTKGLGEDAPQPRQADERPAPGWTPSFNPAPKPSKGK